MNDTPMGWAVGDFCVEKRMPWILCRVDGLASNGYVQTVVYYGDHGDICACLPATEYLPAEAIVFHQAIIRERELLAKATQRHESNVAAFAAALAALEATP